MKNNFEKLLSKIKSVYPLVVDYMVVKDDLVQLIDKDNSIIDLVELSWIIDLEKNIE